MLYLVLFNHQGEKAAWEKKKYPDHNSRQYTVILIIVHEERVAMCYYANFMNSL